VVIAVVFLQGSFYNLTLQWLIKHNYPPGPIHLTRTHAPTLPVYASVGNFKVQYMQGLRAKGFELYAAYGNTGTDVRAYEAAGIPKERCAAAFEIFSDLKLLAWTSR
jgi:phosphatidate phosphatase PAH1